MENITILKDIMEANNTQFHSYSDYSVTGLLDPPKVTILRKRHPNKPSIKSQIAAFYGTANHDRMERMLRLYPTKYALERSIVMPFVIAPSGMLSNVTLTLSGKYDVLDLDTKFLWDLKTTNTWSTIFDPDMIKWHEQQNIYHYMCNYVGEEIKGLRILAWYKDWKRNMALRDRTYPQAQVVEYELKMWGLQKTEQFIDERLDLMYTNSLLEDDEIPPCSREDRWERHPDGETVKYALMKDQNSGRALRCKSSLEEIVEFARTSKALNSNSFIEVRYAEPTRCVEYCGVNYACHWYKQYCSRTEAGGALVDFIPIEEVL